MKVSIDSSLCTGCGLCVDICGAVFEMGGDGLAKVKAETVPADAEAAVQESASSCPVAAIKVD